MWTVVKIAGIVSAVLVTLLFIALLVMVTRPALLIGVDGNTLAESVSGGNGPYDEGTCRKQDDGNWVCRVKGPNTGTFDVNVNWMGCWTGVPAGQSSGSDQARETAGCIDLNDIISFD